MTLKQVRTASRAEEWLPTRQSLISRLKNWDDHQSWSDFFTVYWKLIYSTALRGGLTEAEAQDVVQETVISVCKAIQTLKYDRRHGSFKSWLLQLTSWRIKDQLRKRLPDYSPLSAPFNSDDPSGAAGEPVEPVAPELEQLWDNEWEGNLLDAAIERAKKRLDPKQFQLFDLAVIQQWPIDKIRSVLHVSRARIYVTKHRVSAAIRKELKQLKSNGC